ncbi:MAG: hypothetical protein JWM31_2845, partial [Solirubrobacterales bacterium]|nr:hypothetical protein [Solirubrobacterales bacterium]
GAYFYLDSFDEGVNEFGPCPWTVRTLETTETGDTTADVIARHLLPAVGDRCWVTFTGDADGVGDNPVILMWWPLGRGFQDTRV